MNKKIDTGLIYKNGKKIFSGDIVKFNEDSGVFEFIYNIYDNPELLKVE